MADGTRKRTTRSSARASASNASVPTPSSEPDKQQPNLSVQDKASADSAKKGTKRKREESEKTGPPPLVAPPPSDEHLTNKRQKVCLNFIYCTVNMLSFVCESLMGWWTWLEFVSNCRFSYNLCRQTQNQTIWLLRVLYHQFLFRQR